MKSRQKPYGHKNIIGRRVIEARCKSGLEQGQLLAKLQLAGMDICPSALSKIEGQDVTVHDYQLYYFAKTLGVSIDWLLGVADD